LIGLGRESVDTFKDLHRPRRSPVHLGLELQLRIVEDDFGLGVSVPGAGLVIGKVAVVTGAGSGIGRATAILLAAEGATGVLVSDLSQDNAARTVEEIRADGGTALAMAIDVTDAAQVDSLFDTASRIWGQVDCAVNNAGISGPMQPLADYGDDQWRQVIDVNLTGVFHGMRAAVAAMAGRGGSIVNVSSGAAVHPPAGLAPYAASKAAIVGLTRSAAADYAASGIRINSVLPGPTRTALWESNLVGDIEAATRAREARLPIGRVGRADEVAEAIVWLCSDRASYVHGVDLLVDGGTHAFQF
jgi:NAD(P)-dependent dehydrogenase (short-subunit alcohol dehydrogenase family)